VRLTREHTLANYKSILDLAAQTHTEAAAIRELAKKDLFFLLVRVFGREDINKDWLYERCRDVQEEPDGCLDLWAREHYKSTIITYGKTIQDILNNPDITVGIFSFNRPIAKGFLRQIKYELETNQTLKTLFPDVLYQNPTKESPRWSEENGIVVKRSTNPKESTVEAWGLVDGQPTSRHYRLMIYDDVITRESVTTPEMIKKVTDAWELSRSLSADGGVTRYIGTRYHANDTYQTMIDRGAANLRVFPATDTGEVVGKPVLFSEGYLNDKRRDMGPYVFACQMLQNPQADETQGFELSWLRFWRPEKEEDFNVYLFVDPANEKRKTNDYTSMWVVGAGRDGNYYVFDVLRDRLNLTQRAEAVFDFHARYNPIDVYYEHYGMQADIQHIKYVQDVKNYRFEVKPVGGSTPKPDRIKRLVPVFEQNRMYLPEKCIKRNYEGKMVDIVEEFIKDEYTTFPVMSHDDMLDCLARIEDPDVNIRFPAKTAIPFSGSRRKKVGWMAA
jgi:predicted phage terminase large subunit-like protein